MSRLFAVAALACFFATSSFAETAADAGLCKGDGIEAFYVTKVGGAPDDGVAEGRTLCYRCKYGSSPMVMVFTREGGEKVTKFVKQLDEAVGMHSEESLKGLVTVIGGEEADLTKEAMMIAKESDSKNVPVAVAKDSEMGPSSYKLNPDSAVVVVVVKDSHVVARHDFSSDSIDVAAVMSEVKEMLN